MPETQRTFLAGTPGAVAGVGIGREQECGAPTPPLLDAHTLRVFLGDDKSAAPAPAEVVR